MKNASPQFRGAAKNRPPNSGGRKLFQLLLDDEVQHESENDEESGKPFGGSCKLSVEALALVLRHKGLVAAAEPELLPDWKRTTRTIATQAKS